MADTPLFTFDADGRWRLAYDDLQWIVQRRDSKPRARSSGYAGVSFIATEKRILADVIREKGVPVTAEAAARLDALPDSFKVFARTPREGPRKPRKPVSGTQPPEGPLHAPPTPQSAPRPAISAY